MNSKFIFSIIALLGCTFCFAQDMVTLEKRANELYNYLMTGKYDSVVPYIHPSMYNEISKDEYLADLKSLNTKKDGITISMINVPPSFNFKEIKIINKNYYCIFYYNQLIKISVEHVVDGFTKELLIRTYKKMYNTDKVVFNERENALLVQRRLQRVALADELTGYEWKFFASVKDQKLSEILGL